MKAERIEGLPAHGPKAVSFPCEWERSGREGFVVRFETECGKWVGNFMPGPRGLDCVAPHPDGVRVCVVAGGDLWSVHPDEQAAERLAGDIVEVVRVHDPDGWIYSTGLALARLCPAGVLWHTKRLSYDGIRGLRISGSEVVGEAWEPHQERWHEFQVSLRTGESVGGTYGDTDLLGWERLAT